MPRRKIPAAVTLSGDRLSAGSGILTVARMVEKGTDGWVVEQAAVYRTRRRLFEGCVLIPSARRKAS